MNNSYGERLAYRRSLGLRIFPSLGTGPFARDTTVPAPLIEGYTRTYWSASKGSFDKTPMAHERHMAWFLSKLKRGFYTL